MDYKKQGTNLSYDYRLESTREVGQIKYDFIESHIELDEDTIPSIEFISSFETKEDLIGIILLWHWIEQKHKGEYETYTYYITDDINFIGILVPINSLKEEERKQ